MQIRTITRYSILALLITTAIAIAAPVSRVTNFTDGEVLTSSQLNSEFNNIIGGTNSINNAQVASDAQISPTKISSAIKGTAINRDSSTGALSVKVDASTITTTGDNLQVPTGGITATQIGTGAVTSDKILNGTIATADIADNAITLAKGIDRTPIEDTGSYQAEGSFVYNEETSIQCNSTSSCGSVNLDLTTYLTVSGTRPVIYIASVIPGTTGYVRIFASSGSSFNATASVFWYMRKNGGSLETSGSNSLQMRIDSSPATLDYPCSSLSTVFYPSSSGEWFFGSGLGNIGPTAAVTSSIVNCRVQAYEL